MPLQLSCTDVEPCNCTSDYPHGPFAYGYCFSDDEERRGALILNVQFLIIIIIVLSIMTALGAKMDLAQLGPSKVTKPVFIGLLGQCIINPVVMVALTALFDLSPLISLGALMVSIAPGGNGSNILTWLAKGTLEISVMVTTVSSVCALGTFPLLLMAGTTILQLEAVAPDFRASIMAIAGLICPLCFGMLVKFCLTKKCGERPNLLKNIDRVTSGMILFGIFNVVIYIVLYFLSPYDFFFMKDLPVMSWGCAVVQNVVGIMVGYGLSFVCRLPTKFHRTLAFEVGVQNLGIPLGTVSLALGSMERGVTKSYIVAYAITGFFANYGMAMIFRYAFPLKEDGANNGSTGNDGANSALGGSAAQVHSSSV